MGGNDRVNHKSQQKIVAVCGVKNSGKTSFLEKLVKEYTAKGRKAAVIKHDGHDFTCDVPGTDSYRLKEAGAYGIAVFSARRVFVHQTGTGKGADWLIRLFPEADILFIEGMKDSTYPKIELIREGISSLPASNPAGRFLLVTDRDLSQYTEPAVGFGEIGKVVERIDAYLEKEGGILAHAKENEVK